MPATESVRVCLVCAGNICRSPIAEAVLRSRVEAAGLADRVAVDSAGTGSWHVGQRADPRARSALTRAGFSAEGHTARQFERGWFTTRDLVVVADRENLRDLTRLARGDRDATNRIHLLREWDSQGPGLDVPDPYYGDDRDFLEVLAISERSTRGLLEHVRTLLL